MFNFWDLYALVYDGLPAHFKPYQSLLSQVTSELDMHAKKGKILDSGCGTGNFSISLAESGYNVLGIDFANSMIRRAKRKKEKAGLDNLEFTVSDIGQGLSFPNENFDGVISIHSLYTMKDPAFIISEYHRVLDQNGIFIASEVQGPIKILPLLGEVKEKSGFIEAVKVFYSLFLLGLFNILIGKRQTSGVYHYWDKNQLLELLVDAGFEVISIEETYINNQDVFIVARKV